VWEGSEFCIIYGTRIIHDDVCMSSLTC